MKKIVVLTGAGVSQESGIQTFRDSSESLWNNYKIEDVATIDAWRKNRELVLDFYNQRRSQLKEVEPNEAHFSISRLQESFDVEVITQNVDNLHERADSNKVFTNVALKLSIVSAPFIAPVIPLVPTPVHPGFITLATFPIPLAPNVPNLPAFKTCPGINIDTK